MANQAAQTAFGPISAVAIEQYYPEGQRLLDDELACPFLPPGLQALVKLTRWPPVRKLIIDLAEKRAPGVWGGVLCRKRYIDEKLVAALDGGLGCIVILGAGLDTRACRLAVPAGVAAFELDLAENIAYKRARLEQMYGNVPARVTLAEVDFEKQDLGSVLQAHGYPAGQTSFFVCEAVTQYLTEAGVRNVFRFLSTARTGSRLVFTYIRQDFIDGTDCRGLESLQQAYVKEQIWRFGMQPECVAAFLAEYGWKELEQMGSREFVAQYVEPTGRALAVMEIERAVYAQKT